MKKAVLALALGATVSFCAGLNSDMQAYANSLAGEAKKENPAFSGFDAKRGEAIFFKKMAKDGKEVSCASCHSDNLKAEGQNFKTGRRVKPLAPSVNPSRLTDVDEVKKWLKRNFNDVYSREGTATQKGDVLYFLAAQ